MPQAHDDAGSVFVRSPCADFQIAWQILLGDDQRMIAGRGHRRRQAAKDGLAIVLNLTGFAVHQVLRANHLAAEGCADRLVSEADSEQRHTSPALVLARKMADQFDADAGFLRGAGSGRKHDAFGVHRLDLSDGYFVVATNLYLGAQFSEVLDEVVSERIVVIEDEDHEFIVAPEARFPMCGDGAPPRPAGRSPATTRSWTLNVSMKKRKLCEPNGNESMHLENVETSLSLDRHAANCHAYRQFLASF
jgi:hypothetical protein